MQGLPPSVKALAPASGSVFGFGRDDGAGPLHVFQPAPAEDPEDREAWEEFMHLWQKYVHPASTLSRPLMREVVLRAIRDMGLASDRSTVADELVAQALSSAPPALTMDHAFDVYRTVRSSLLDGHGDGYSGAEDFGGHVGESYSMPHAGFAAPGLASSGSLPQGARAMDFGPVHSLGLGGLSARSFFQVSPARQSSAPQAWETGSVAGGGGAASSTAAAPMRPHRAALESTHAGLRASVGGLQTSYEQLAHKMELLRSALARSDQIEAKRPPTAVAGGNGLGSGLGGKLAEVHRRLNMRRVHAVSLEAELSHCADRFTFSSSIFEKQQREMVALREDSAQQASSSELAAVNRDRLREELQAAQELSSELARRLKTEQLRSMMLREAFEQEQSRVGDSLGQAEAWLGDLVAATEGTRRMEVEEQALARECVAALNELHGVQVRDEVAADAKMAQLRCELDDVRSALAKAKHQPHAQQVDDASAAVRATATYAKIEAERYAVATQLGETRRKCLGAAAGARRQAADFAVVRRELVALQGRAAKVAQELCAAPTLLGHEEFSASRRSESLGLGGGGGGGEAAAALRLRTLRPRLHLEEETVAALQGAAERLSAELRIVQDQSVSGNGSVGGPSVANSAAAAELAAADVERQGAISAAAAERCAGGFRRELEAVRAELSGAAAGALPSSSPLLTPPNTASVGHSPSPPVELLGRDLAAAALQRRVGAAFASERETQCRLQEELFRERQVSDANDRLREQLHKVQGMDGGRDSFLGLRTLSALGGEMALPRSSASGRQLEVEVEVHMAEIHRAGRMLQQTEARLQALQREPDFGEAGTPVHIGQPVQFLDDSFEMQVSPSGSSTAGRLASLNMSPSAAAAVAAADLVAAPGVAAAQLQARLAAHLGGVDFPGVGSPVSSAAIARSSDLAQLRRQLQGLRAELDSGSATHSGGRGVR